MSKQWILGLALLPVLSQAHVPMRNGMEVLPRPNFHKKDTLKIVAQVAKEPITQLDVLDRARFMVITMGLPVTPENIQQMRAQALSNLVDERLRMQEAKRHKVLPSGSDIATFRSHLEKSNGMSLSDFSNHLNQGGIRSKTLDDYIAGTVSWQKLLKRRLMGQINITDVEIDRELKKLKETLRQTQYRVAEIKLPYEDGVPISRLRAKAQKILSYLRQGARFEALAAQFSISQTAQRGGDLGWIVPGVLADTLNKAMLSLSVGKYSNVIATPEGLHIIKLHDRKKTDFKEVDAVILKRAFLPLQKRANDADKETVASRLRALKQTVKSGDEFVLENKRLGGRLEADLGPVILSNLPSNIQPIIKALPESGISDPIIVDGGMAIFMRCANTKVCPFLPAREDVTERLILQKHDSLSRQYMASLRHLNSVIYHETYK